MTTLTRDRPDMLVLNLTVEETSSLPQVGSPADMRDHPGSCFCEVLPHSDLPPDVLFPQSVLIRSGEVGPPAWWSDHDSNVAALHVFKIVDAFFIPPAGLVITQAGDVMRLPFQDAAYFSPDLTRVPGIEVDRDVTRLRLPEHVPTLSHAAVSMSQGAVNYGHFVLDCLPALLSLTEEPAFSKFKPVAPPLRSWQKRHFELLRIDPVELLGNLYFVGELIYTSAMHHYLHNPNLNYGPVRTRQIMHVASASRQASSRLYLSRKGSGNRRMTSETRLLRRLERLGFRSVDPAGLTVDDQIALFASADIIIGPAGAGFANVLYCSPGTWVIEIQPSGLENQWVRNICLQTKCNFAAYFCRASRKSSGRPETHLVFDIDVDTFVDFVGTTIGLVDNPPRSIKATLASLARRYVGR